MRFWLDRGVDGFRIDVAHGMAKPDGLPDMVPIEDTGLLADHGPGDLRFDHDGVHDVHRRIRAVLDEYPGTMAVGEVWVSDDDRLAHYVREDELQLAFNFKLLTAEWERRRAPRRDRPLAGDGGADAGPGLLGAVQPRRAPARQPLRRRRARPAPGPCRARCCSWPCPARSTSTTATSWACPTSTTCPTRCCRTRSGSARAAPSAGRDGCRVPMPWAGAEPPFGFSTAERTWLPMPADWGALTVEAQDADPGSMLSLYRAALALRASSPAFGAPELEWLPAPEGCLAFRRPGGLVCLVNLSGAPVPLPEGRVLLASADTSGGHAARRRGGVAAA